jgi:hypothetical protein
MYGIKKYNSRIKGKNKKKFKDNKEKRINFIKETNMVIILKVICLRN